MERIRTASRWVQIMKLEPLAAIAELRNSIAVVLTTRVMMTQIYNAAIREWFVRCL